MVLAQTIGFYLFRRSKLGGTSCVHIVWRYDFGKGLHFGLMPLVDNTQRD